MAMNTKEQSALDAAVNNARLNRALRWSDALRAMRCEMELRFARTLARVDEAIETALQREKDKR